MISFQSTVGILHTIFFHRLFTPVSPTTHDVLDTTLGPLRKAYLDFLADPAELDRILAAGAERARARAGAVMERVRVGVGTD